MTVPHRPRRPCLARALLALAASGLAAGAGALEPGHLVAGFPRGALLIETSGFRCLLIDAWLAVDNEQRAQGLMYVTDLGEFEGMYFAYPQPVEIAMWMKNTYISLDMLFIREDGIVGSIAARTTPHSTDRISAGLPAIGVLELKAGFAERWGVVPGNRVQLLQAE